MNPSAEFRASSRFIGVLVLVLITMGAFFVLDVFLARMEQGESRAEAERDYQAGERLMKQSQYDAAVEQFQNAFSTVRAEKKYQLALAQALMAAGKLKNAEDQADQLLQADQTNGDANLTLARIFVKQGRITDAIAYYRRAIYGHWDQNAAQRRTDVRWELTDLLRQQNASEDLLAELLLLQGESGNDAETQRKIAHLFIRAGSPDRALPLFSALLRKNPNDADAYAGMGEAQFARANYRAAVNDFQAAVRLNPSDEVSRQRLELCQQVLALDPMARGLGTEERTERSVKLVQVALDGLTDCAGPEPAGPMADLIEQTRKALKRPALMRRGKDAVDKNLALAGRLWQARTQSCTTAGNTSEQALALVLKDLSQ
jgi:tetratricopeptide (TPR) repeat protein